MSRKIPEDMYDVETYGREINAKFIGYVFDRLGDLPVLKTRKYNTYREAHKAAEILSKKHRYTQTGRDSISVSLSEEQKPRFAEVYVNYNPEWGPIADYRSLDHFVEKVNEWRVKIGKSKINKDDLTKADYSIEERYPW